MEALGYIGGGLLATQMWPQIFRVIKLKNASQISWCMIAANTSGLSCMAAYGLINHDVPLCSTASLSLINSIVLGALKWWFISDRVI